MTGNNMDNFTDDASPKAGVPTGSGAVQWRPMKAAPKDENILVATTGGWVGEARLDYHPHNDNWVWIWAGGVTIHPDHELLAWMPLPEHPTAASKVGNPVQAESPGDEVQKGKP